jgi:hypothetical protein
VAERLRLLEQVGEALSTNRQRLSQLSLLGALNQQLGSRGLQLTLDVAEDSSRLPG